MRGLCTDNLETAERIGASTVVTEGRLVTEGDWAYGYNKVQCPDDEYVAGVAYTWNLSDGGVRSAVLCRPLH